MEMEEECWDQMSPLLMNEGPMGDSRNPGYGCGGPEDLFVSGQTTTGASPPLGTSASSLSPGSSTAGVAPGAVSPGGSAAPGPGSAASGTSCCENGRPIMTDPVSGQTVCSCQYDPSRLALSYPRLPASGVGVYGTPYPSTDQNPYPSIGVDSSAFYSPLSNPYALKDGGSSADMSAWTSAGLQTTPGYYPYDPALAAYGYSAGYDLSARRKNATRESTATLKAWLNEHKKNPYPTKGEKIMLAIITKMTLTQVSTWFANARRRLKKENKMTWEPKNKTDEDDDAIVSDSDEKDKDDLVKDRLRDDKESLHHVKMENRHDKDLDDEEDTDDEDRKPDALGLNPHHHHHHLHHHHNHMHHPMLGGLKEEMKMQDCGIPIPATKPKIWSLADTAACKTPPPTQQQSWLAPNSNCSGSPMVGMNSFALPSPTNSSSSPYSRYGGFLGHYNGNNHAATMGNYNPPSGFPEVQTDTPPQTPPNMKLPSVANNIINSNACFGGSNPVALQHNHQSAQSTSYHHNNNNNNNNSSNHNNNYINSFHRLPSNQLSPQKDRQDYQLQSPPHQQQQQQQPPPQQQLQHQHPPQQQPTLRPTANPQHQHPVNPNEGTAFKPFFKNSPPLNNGFVSPV